MASSALAALARCSRHTPGERTARRLQRRAAMAQAILALGLELRRRQPKLGEPEVRVVAESTRAARRLENVSLPHALRIQRRGVRRAVQVDERAAVAGAARRE